MKSSNSTTLAASSKPQELESPVEIDEQIRRRAFELYEQHGRKDGQALDDWLQAEAELLQDKPNRPPA
jgi:hypothetical protein